MGHYTDDTNINTNDLNEEVVQQPAHYHYYCNLHGEAEINLKDAKDELERMEAIVQVKVRRNRKKYNHDGKEKMINAIVRNHVLVRKAIKGVNTALKEEKSLKAIVKSLEHKRSSLGHLVESRSKGFFSEVNVKPSRKEGIERTDGIGMRKSLQKSRKKKKGKKL